MSHHVCIPALSTASSEGEKSAVAALCSPPSGIFVGHITCKGSTSRHDGEDNSSSPTSEVNVLRSSSLLPTPFANDPAENVIDGSGEASSTSGNDEPEQPASKPTAIACLDLSDRGCTGRKSGANKGYHRLDRILSSLNKKKGSVSSTSLSSTHSSMHGDTFGGDGDSALLAVGHDDGSVSIRLLLGPPPEPDDVENMVGTGKDADSAESTSAHESLVVASTKDYVSLLGGPPSCSIVDLAFLPISTKKAAADTTIEIVALTKGGKLFLFDLSPQDKEKGSNDSNQSLARGRCNDRSDIDLAASANAKTIVPKFNLAIRSIVGVSKYSDSDTTGTLAVGQTGNGVVYVAIGIDKGVLVLRPSSPTTHADDGTQYVWGWHCVASIDLPSPTTSLDFSTVGSCVVGYGDAPVVLCAGQADGEVALLDATAASGLDESKEDCGTPTFQPFYFIEPAELVSAPDTDENAFAPITSVACHRDWTKQGAGRLLVAIASGAILRVMDGSAFQVIYQYDFGRQINDITFALDKTGAPRVVVANEDGNTVLVGLRTWGLLLEGSQFLKLHEKFHPSSVPSPFVRRSSTGRLLNDESAMCTQWEKGDSLFEASGRQVLVYNSSCWNYDAPPHASSVNPTASIRFSEEEKDIVRTISVSKDGKFIAASIEKYSGGFELCIYKRPQDNEKDGELILPEHCRFASNITSLSYSPDSKYLCIATLYSCAVFAVDSENGISDEPLKKFDVGRDTATWSSDGKYLAIGKWSNVLLAAASDDFDEVCSIDVGIDETHRITCLSFDFSGNHLLIGCSDDSICFAEEDANDGPGWTIVGSICHPNQVTTICCSPDPSSSLFSVLGRDEKCYIYSKTSRTILQVIHGEGPFSAVSFHPSGSMLALSGETSLDSQKLRGDVLLVRVGEILNPLWYPLQSSRGDISSESILQKLNALSEIERQQLLYHNGSDDVWPFASRIKVALEVQRKKKQMAKRGSARRGILPPREEVTSILADVLDQFPRSVFATRGSNGKSAFDIAIEMDDPRSLKQLFYFALVACRAHSHLMMSDDLRSGYLTRLLTLSSNEYPEVCMDIVHQMVLWPVPTLELLETWKIQGGEPLYQVGSSPTSQEIFDGSIQPFEYGALSRPMVLPLPGVCSLPFLSAVVSKVPVEVFNHDILGLILDELWFNGTRTIFLVDFLCFLLLFASSSALFVLHAAATKSEDDDMTCYWNNSDMQILGLCLAVFTLNVLFGVRELR